MSFIQSNTTQNYCFPHQNEMNWNKLDFLTLINWFSSNFVYLEKAPICNLFEYFVRLTEWAEDMLNCLINSINNLVLRKWSNVCDWWIDFGVCAVCAGDQQRAEHPQWPLGSWGSEFTPPPKNRLQCFVGVSESQKIYTGKMVSGIKTLVQYSPFWVRLCFRLYELLPLLLPVT